MKNIGIIVLIVLCVFWIHSCMNQQEARQLVLIQSLTATDARIVWSESMSDGESRHLTYWNNDHCLATIGIRNDKSYYVRGSHCSDYKLTK